jgi:hypothetical protein
MAAEDGVQGDKAAEQGAAFVAAVRAKLREAAEKQTFGKDRPATASDHIRAMRREILVLRTRRATWEDIASLLAQNGIVVKADTVRQVILALNKDKKAKKKRSELPTVAKQSPKQTTPRESAEEKPSGHGNLTRQY